MIANEQVTAKAVVIFVAGLESTTSTLAFGLYEFARNQEVQAKCRAEVEKILSHSEGPTFEDLEEMTYLDCCINEMLRKYPVASSINRVCSESCAIPSTNLVIPKGTMVYMSSFRIHRDPDIFENPMQFNPERFAKSPKGCNISGISYFPFGAGHRICIGQNVAHIILKIIFSRLLCKFDFKLAKRQWQRIAFYQEANNFNPFGKGRNSIS